MSKWTPQNSKLNTTLLLFYVDTTKSFKAIRGTGYLFVPKGGTFPTETITLVVRSSGFLEAYNQTCLKWDKKIYHGMLMPLHEFRRTFGFNRITKARTSTFAGEPRCRGVRNSSQFLAWDLRMQPRTHIWFFNPFICTGSCACSSN